MAPAGDTLAEAVAGAELRSEAVEKRASISADPRVSLTAAPPRGVGDGEDAPQDNTPNDLEFPTAHELGTLRRVPNHVPLKLFSIAFIELCERFSYYGTTVVCKFTSYLALNLALHLTS